MKAAELRQSILQAAVQGKLVPQDLHDEPASVLLERIRAEKAHLVKEGKFKKEKPLPPITDDEIPYDIPDGWIWSRLGDICYIIMGQSPDGTSVIDKRNVINGIEFHQGKSYFSDKYLKRSTQVTTDPKKIAMENSVLLAVRAPVGSVNITTREICIGRGLCALLPLCRMTSDFLFYFLKSMEEDFVSKATGTTFIAITAETIRNQLFPLPPLAEQQRIVAKVNELMALCDELEAAEQELDALESRFEEHLPKSILQAAVQGKLVPQDLHDEPASVLLERIRAEKARLVKEGKIKKEKPLPPITDDEIPYDLPDGWIWSRLGDICYIIMGQSPDGTSVIDKRNVINGIEFHQGKSYFSDKYLKRSTQVTTDPKKIAMENSVLLAVRAPVGSVNITTREICIGRGLCALLPLCRMTSDFLFYFLKSMEEDFVSKATGTTFIAITAETIRNQLFPLPPLAEQQRIVAKVNELMALCEEIKAVKTKPIEQRDTNRIIDFPVAKQEEQLQLAARGEISKKPSAELLQAIDDMFAEDE
jgi:type I restriction enzyme S subunit